MNPAELATIQSYFGPEWGSRDTHPFLSKHEQAVQWMPSFFERDRQRMEAPETRIIEFGAAGGFQLYLPNYHISPNVTAIDCTDQALSYNPAATKRIGDITDKRFLASLPTDFDFAVSIFVMRYIPKEGKLFKRMLERLQSGGVLYCIDFQTLFAGNLEHSYHFPYTLVDKYSDLLSDAEIKKFEWQNKDHGKTLLFATRVVKA